MKAIPMILLAVLASSCTTVEQIKQAEGLYCSEVYRGMRAVGRSVLTAGAGVVINDVCDTIDDIVAEENADGVDKSDS